jgi:hypothetical protein
VLGVSRNAPKVWGEVRYAIANAPYVSFHKSNTSPIACLRVCQMLSNTYRSIELFRFDDQTGVVFIFVNEELQIIVPANGNWRFLNATEF